MSPLRLWLVAARPRTLPAAVAPVLVGTALAAGTEDVFRPLRFVCALTAKDVPKNVYTILCLIGVEPDEEQVLAEERVRYRGEQIAAIVAETEEAALEAVNRVKLDLEELPAVFDVEEALKPDAPRVTHWDTNHFWYEGHHCRRVRYGDAAAARAGADHVIEGTYQNSPT